MKNVLVGQSGGPTAVINSSLAGVYETAKACGAEHVYGMQYGIAGVLEGKLVDLDAVLSDKMDIELLKRTPSSFLGSCRYKLPQPDVDEAPFVQLFDLFKQYDIGAVFYIGGNDSMDTISKLSVYGKTIVQKQTDTLYLVQNPPMPSLTREELDEVFDLPFTRTYHPSYEAMGGVDAIKEVEFSIIQNRGCFGNCNFCAITFHQGRQVVSRSEQSILHEAEEMTHNPHFKGYIHDVGGPTADFRYPSCKKQLKYGLCQNRKCLAPKPCPQLEIDHMEYVELLRKLRRIKGVKKVFVRSGIRYDYLNADPNPTFLQELVKYHISGQLKVAPEHCVNHVLDKMGKPHIQDFDRFCKRFYEETKRIGKEQYLVPYLMSSHPGCTIADAVELAVYLKRHHMRPEQVQDFYPTPSTLSTCMYYTGINPLDGKSVYVPKDPHEKAIQRALMLYKNPANRKLVLEGLQRAGRMDLVGFGPKCLIRPEKKNSFSPGNKNSGSSRRPAHRTTIRNTHKKKTKK